MWVVFIPNLDFENAFIVKVVLSFNNLLKVPNVGHLDVVDTVSNFSLQD